MHVSESVGWICSVIGTMFGYIYLKLMNTQFNLFESATVFIQGAIIMIVVGSAFMLWIAVMEKYNKYQEKKWKNPDKK